MRPTLPGLALLAAVTLAPAVPAAAAENGNGARRFEHALKAGDIAEECVRLEKGRSRAFEWKSDVPVDFNIHFHQGDKVTYPVKADGQAKGQGRFKAAIGEDYCWMWTARSPARVTGSLAAEE